MTNERTLLVATDGQAVMRSHDDGKSWYRINTGQDLEFDDRVRCLLIDPADPRAIFAGAERGLFRSADSGSRWDRVDCALNDYAVWKLVASESDPKVIYAGTGSPTRSILFRSRDGGASWERTPLEMPERCAGVSRPRMLAIAIDPDDANDVMVGVEEGGYFRSRDGGDSWKRLDTEWEQHPGNSDVHDIVIMPGDPKVILVLTVVSLFRSTDDGKSWTYMNARDTWGLRYSRKLERKHGSNRKLLLGIGDGTPGTKAAVFASDDAGESWTRMEMDTPANSCLWAFGSNVANPDFLLAGTKFGNLYRSEDGGHHWTKEWREFNEITDLVWVDAVPQDMELPHVTG
ncbi:MAG: glycosyl hydrolase [Pseudomonadota bacterium]